MVSVSTQVTDQANESSFTSVEVATAILKKKFGSSYGFAIANNKRVPGTLIVNIDSTLLSFDSIHKNAKSLPQDVSVKSVACGIELRGDFNKIEKIINICINNK